MEIASSVRPGAGNGAHGRLGVLGLVALAVQAAGCAAGPPPAAVPDIDVADEVQLPPDAIPFAAGVYLGDETRPGRIGPAIERFAEQVGERPGLVKVFTTLEADFGPRGWMGRMVREIQRTGATPYVALSLHEELGRGVTDAVLDDLIAGRYDDELRSIGRGLATLERTLVLEPGWEMNGDWKYDWQGIYNNPDAPDKFIAAWRRVVDVVRAEGATRVQWAFNPNIGNPVADYEDAGPSHWNWYGYYYPGDAYVDYIGVHAYNAPSLWRNDWLAFERLVGGEVADHAFPDMVHRFPDKPVIFGEIASGEEPGHSKATWIAEAYEAMIEHPRVVGAVWFNVDKEVDWRIATSPAALAAYRNAVAHPWVVPYFPGARAR